MKKSLFKIIILSLFSVLVITMGLFFSVNVHAENPYTAPTLNGDNFYELSSANDLNWFSYEVNNNKHYKYNAILVNDIVMNDQNLASLEDKSSLNTFNPIGDYVKTTSSFQGIFEGNNHKISGIYINGGTQRYIGLFGHLKNGTVRNLTLDNIYYEATPTNNLYIGGIAGYLGHKVSIDNCHVKGTLFAHVDRTIHMGGIAGYNYGSAASRSSIKNCSSQAFLDVSTSKDAHIGGIIGYAYYMDVENATSNVTVSTNDTQQTIGGVAGYTVYTSVKNSINNSNIISSNNYVGGIVGDARNKTEINGCKNYGSITGKRAGGISYRTNMGNIVNCENFGDIEATIYAGGIVSTVTSRTPRVEGSSNYGSVHANTYAGGIVGYSNYAFTISYCRNTGDISGGERIGGIAADTYANIIACENYGKVHDATVSAGGIASRATTIKYSLNQGEIDTNNASAGACGISYFSDEISNCYNTGSIIHYENQVAFAICADSDMDKKVFNCYYTNPNVAGVNYKSSGSDARKVSSLDFASGKIAYLLNDDPYFKQTIGIDDFPTAIGESKEVFRNCDSGVASYSNTFVIEEHNFINGICACGELEKPEVSLDGTYLIRNAGNLLYFAKEVNKGNNTIDGKLMNNITINQDVLSKIHLNKNLLDNVDDTNLIRFTPIGNASTPYKGKFDGNHYTISGLYIDEYEIYSALFGVIGKDGIVKDLKVVDSAVIVEKSQTTDYSPFFSGIIYGVNIGTIDNVEVLSSMMGVRKSTESVAFEYNYTDALMYTSYKENYISIMIGYDNKESSYLSLVVYVIGEGVFDGLFTDLNYYAARTVKIEKQYVRVSFTLECVFIGEGITELAEDCFDYVAPKNIILPSTLKIIGEKSIVGCKDKIITIPDSVTTIKYDAFYWADCKAIIVPKSVTNIGAYWHNTRTAIFYLGTKEEYLALGQTISSYCDYVFEYDNSSLEIGNIYIDFNLENGKNPYAGCYLQYSTGTKVARIPITNATSYSFKECPTNRFVTLEIISPLGVVAQELGTCLLTEANMYTYKKNVVSIKATPKIEIHINDENGISIKEYRIDLYQGDYLIDSQIEENGYVVFKNCISGNYYAKVVLPETYLKKYQAISDFELSLLDTDVNKTISLVLIKEKTVTFTIIDDDETPLENAIITVEEVYSAKNHKFYTAITDSEGKATLSLHNISINYSINLDGYFVETGTIDSNTTKLTVSITPINGIPVLLNVFSLGNNGVLGEVENYNDGNIKIVNKTKNKAILDYTFVNKYVYLPLSMAEYGDEIIITISGIENKTQESLEFVLVDNTMVNITLKEMNYFQFYNVSAYVHIFDDSDNLVASFNANKINKSPYLDNGTYKILIIDTDLGSHITSLTELTKYNFVENQNYYLLTKVLNDSTLRIENYKVDSNLDLISNSIFNYKTSSIILSDSSFSIGEYITQRIMLDNAKDYSGMLEITIPEECNYQNKSLRVDGKDREVTVLDNKLILEITSSDKQIKYTFRCNKEADYLEAKARILANDTYYPIPISSYSVKLLIYSLDFEYENSNRNIIVTGRTLSDGIVELYDNNKLLGKTVSNITGNFTFNEKINSNIEEHRIYFKIYKDDRLIQTSEKHSIFLSKYRVEEFIIKNVSTVDLVNSKKPVFTMNPAKPVYITIKLAAPADSVDVIVALTDGNTKVISLVYNSSTNTWEGEAKFTSSVIPKNFYVNVNTGKLSTYRESYKNIEVNSANTETAHIKNDVFSITSIGPTKVANADEVTFRVNGSMLSTTTTFAVRDGALRTYPTNVYYVSLNEVYVTFDLSSFEVGKYYLEGEYHSTTIEKEFTIGTSLTYGYLGYDLDVPTNSTMFAKLTGHVILSNLGYSDCTTKVIVIKGTDVVFDNNDTKIIDVISCNGLFGKLLAAEEAIYSFNYTVTGHNPKITCTFLDRIGAQLFNSPDISKTGKDAVLENIYSIIGTDSDSYQMAIADAANYLATIGYKNINLEDCEKVIVAEAKGKMLSDALFVDTIIDKEYFKLYRAYDNVLERRLEKGILGYGFVTNFEMKLESINGKYALVLPEETIFFKEVNGMYYSLDGKYEAVITENTASIKHEDTSYYFENGRLLRVKSRGITLYELTYNSSKLVSIQGLYDLVTFTYSGDFVNKIYLNGELLETYINSNGYLMGIRGDVNYNFSYLLNKKGPLYGALSTQEINDEVITYSYDSLGRVTNIDRGIRSISYEYLGGLLVKMTSAKGEALLYLDYNGNVTKEISYLGLVKEVHYTENGANILINSLTQGVILDERCRMNTFIYADGSTFTHTYLDKQTIITDCSGHSYTYTFDDNGTLIGISYPDGTSEAYTYVNGLLNSKKNRDNTVINYTYDVNGRKTKEEYQDGSYIEYEYNTDSTLKNVKNDTYSMAFSYTKDGILDTVTYKDGKTLHYEYDEQYRVIAITDPLGRITRYEYDDNNQISKVKNSGNTVLAEYTYDEFGRVIKQKNSSSSYTEYTYEGGYIKSIINYGKNKEVLTKFIYTYNLYGLIESVDTTSGMVFYYYDDLGRVNQILSETMHVRYTYDSLGNRKKMIVDDVTTDYTVNDLNQYILIGDKQLSYDLNGNLSSILEGGKTITFTYNSLNQLTKIIDGENTYDYTYDFFGNRDSVTINGTTTNYYFTPGECGKLIASQTGSKGTSYIYGHDLIGAYTNSKMYYYTYDALGNVQEIVNNSGVRQNRYTYDHNFNVDIRTETIANPFTYCGKLQYFDDTSILYKCGRRYILKDALCFTSPERNGVTLGINLYQYAGSNHVNLADKDGDVGVVTATILIGMATGAGISLATQLSNDCFKGKWSSAGTYIGSGISGIATGAAGATVTVTGGAGIALGAAINASGAVISTYVATFVDYAFFHKDFTWDGLRNDVLSNTATAFATGAFSGALGNAIDNGDFASYLTESTYGGLSAALERIFGNNPEYDFEEEEEYFCDALDDGLDGMYCYSVMILVDPAGYVCEGVSSNRISDVKCTLYYSEVSTGKNAIVFANDYWGQNNPLFTDSEGKYAWDVPQGYWQVKFEKEGYFVAYSEWLPVPPIQLDVNVSLMSLYAPEVVECEMKKNEINFSFSQYMFVSEINTEKVKITANGKTISGTFSAIDSEASFDDNTVMLAKTFKFTPDSEFDSLVTIEIGSVKNYANTSLESTYTKSQEFKKDNPSEVDPGTNPGGTEEGKEGNSVNSSLPTGAIVGISIGAVLIAAAIIGVIVFIVIKKKKSSVRE